MGNISNRLGWKSKFLEGKIKWLCIKTKYIKRDFNQDSVNYRNLLQGSFNTDDPYYIVSHSENGGKTKSKIGQSDTKRRENNPDWKNEYVVMFDRNKKQYLHFHVLDKDKFKKDRSLGQVWLNLADYVDKGELATINLDTEGYLIVSSAVSSRVGSGRLNIPPKDHVPQTLQFTLSANHLTSKDGIGFIHMKGDPYVIVHSIDDPNETKLKEVGRTNTISSTNNPVWDEVLRFKYDPSMDQRIRFSVYDDDMFRHDAIDKVWMEVNDYVAKGYNYTLLLPKGGTITVTKL
ncbi:unnamed protein product [Orchesella dallaii]|uniref:C2 domain-containing protein n=1 Tax=Orchesella dallaii TaxID=48710 RepID=A0ABP1RGI5_9HEXA